MAVGLTQIRSRLPASPDLVSSSASATVRTPALMPIPASVRAFMISVAPGSDRLTVA